MADTIRSRLEEIHRKMSGNDRLVLGPVQSEEQVEAFERENGVRLPDDYRAFLRIVANGVTVRKDIQKIFPLDHRLDDAPGMPRPGNLIRGDLRQPFPLTAAVDFEEEGYPEEGEGPAASGTAPGKLFVSDEGSGIYWVLVVNGPERGNMWVESEYGYQPTEPRIGFLEWCERWAEVGWKEGLQEVFFPIDEDA